MTVSNVDKDRVRILTGVVLFLSMQVLAQVSATQMDIFMRQQYTGHITPQEQLQLAQVPPGQRLQVLQAIRMNNNQYAMQFVPQSGPMMGQTMWAMNDMRSPLFNFFSSLGAMTKSADRVEYMEAREPVTAYRSPDPSEHRDANRTAVDTMTQATNKLKDMKNPQKADCLDCITDPNPQLTAGPISGKGTIKTRANGQIREDINADIKCSYGGDVTDGIRLTFAADLEIKVEHNKVTHLKYVLKDGKKTCVADLTQFKQKQVGNTTNIVLQHPNGKTFVAVGANNKFPDRKNPSINVSVNFFESFCPQMNPKLFMQIEADPKTGTCR